MRVGELSTAKAHYAAERLAAGARRVAALRRAVLQGVHAGAAEAARARGRAARASSASWPACRSRRFDRKLGDCLLVAVTEQRTKDEIDAFAAALAKAVA